MKEELYQLEALSDKGRKWIEEHDLKDHRWGDPIVYAEWGYVRTIEGRMIEDGLKEDVDFKIV